MLFLIPIGIIITGIIIYAITRDEWNENGTSCIIAGIIIFALMGFIWFMFYPMSISENAQLISAKKNIEILRVTAIKLNSLAVVESKGKNYIDVANNNQSTNASSAITAYTYKVMEYNQIIAERKLYRSMWWSKSFIAPLPVDCQDLIDVNL